MTEPVVDDIQPAVEKGDKLVSLLERLAEKSTLTDEQAEQLAQERDREEKRKKALDEGIKQIPLEFREPKVIPLPARAGVLQWLDDYWHGNLGDKYSLVMVGPFGCGKTQASWEIVKGLLMEGDDRFIHRTVPEWLLELEPRSAQDTWVSVKKLIDTDLAILDDLGASKLSARREEILYTVVDGRMKNHKPIVFTTNIPPRDFSTYFGGRLADRLAGMSRVVTFPPHSFRRNLDYTQEGTQP